MSKSYVILFFLVPLLGFSQGSTIHEWVRLEEELVISLNFTKTETKELDNYSFKITWGDDVSHSKVLGDYGGISKLEIYRDSTHVQTLQNIQDGLGLGFIDIEFYDFNMDGHMDFRIVRAWGDPFFYDFYLYNPDSKKFEHQPKWDNVRIQKMNSHYHMILSAPSGREMHEQQKLYEVNGLKIIQRETLNMI